MGSSNEIVQGAWAAQLMREYSSSSQTNTSFSAVRAREEGAQLPSLPPKELTRGLSAPPFPELLVPSQSGIRTLGVRLFCLFLCPFLFCLNFSLVRSQGLWREGSFTKLLPSELKIGPHKMLVFCSLLAKSCHQDYVAQQKSVYLKLTVSPNAVIQMILARKKNKKSLKLWVFVVVLQLYRIYLVLNEAWHLHHISIWFVHSQSKGSCNPPVFCRTANWNYLWEKNVEFHFPIFN